MKTTSEIRTYAREYFSIDSGDVSDSLLNTWIKEAFTRIIRSRRQWPHLETTATINVVGGTQSYDYPSTPEGTTMRHITAVYFNKRLLSWQDHTLMIQRYQYNPTLSVNSPTFYSLFGGKVYLWPIPVLSGEAVLHGIREPKTAWMSDASGSADLPEVYEGPLLKWVLCEVAKQQNDITLANNFAQDFAIELGEVNATEINPPLQQPIIMGGGIQQLWARWPWAADVTWT